MLESRNCILCAVLELVGNEDHAAVSAVDRHMHERTRLIAGRHFDAEARHEPCVARCDGLAVKHRRDAVAADFMHIRHTLGVDGFAVGCLETLAYRMVGVALGVGGVLQKHRFVNGVIIHAADLEHATGQRACFVKHDIAHLGQTFEVV